MDTQTYGQPGRWTDGHARQMRDRQMGRHIDECACKKGERQTEGWT